MVMNINLKKVRIPRMIEKYDEYPSVCIDLKKNRVRIHRKTIHQMNDPEYIELLVNPVKGSFIIRTAPDRKNSHRVKVGRIIDDKKCYELYSREFIREIQKVDRNLKSFGSYRIDGCLSADRSAARFILQDAELIDSGKESDFYA